MARFNAIFSMFSGDQLKARALRGIGLTIAEIGGRGVFRLISNLVLTRLLFPEAFGVMALANVFMGGLQMFSDIGLQASIVQSRRGDEPGFLNTAWTLQILRGFLLGAIALGLGYPMAQFYEEPLLAVIMPILAIGPVIAGFSSTNMVTANRHLQLGKVTMIRLVAQILGIGGTILLAYLMGSVYALAIGSLISIVIAVALSHMLLPGIRNYMAWQRDALGELIGFGKFVFFSTAASFIQQRSDKAILGAYISIGLLGVFNIGALLGQLPLQVLRALFRKVVFPLYSRRPPAENPENKRKMQNARRALLVVGISINAVFGFLGIVMIDFLYDERYAMAGPMLIAISLASVPIMLTDGYESALLSYGDSRHAFYVKVLTAGIQLLLLFAGIAWFGIVGAIMASGLAVLITYPLLAYFLRPYAVLDLTADIALFLIGSGLGLWACWLNFDQILALIEAT